MKARKAKNASGNAHCDICNRKSFLETHHIRGRKIPNPNHPSNLVDICFQCHGEIHYGKIILEKWVNSTHGRTLLWHYAEEDSITNDDAAVHQFNKSSQTKNQEETSKNNK